MTPSKGEPVTTTTTTTPRPISAHQGPRGSRRAQPRSAKLPALLLELVIDEYERDLRRSRLSARNIHNYVQILRLAVRFWTALLGRPPTLDDFTLRSMASSPPIRLSPGLLNPPSSEAV